MEDNPFPRLYQHKNTWIITLLITHISSEKARGLSIINHNIADKRACVFVEILKEEKKDKKWDKGKRKFKEVEK